jgi:hypothetical protein
MRVSICLIPRASRPGKRMGSGNSPRSLSPNTDIWRPASPVACRWLSVSRRCAGPARTIANRFGPAAEPAVGVTTADVSGETSQLAVRTPAGALPPNPVRTHLRTSASGPLPQGRHRTLSVTIVGLAPRVLSLTPQVVFFISAGRRRFRRLPSFGSYRASAVIAIPGAFQSDRSIRDNPLPFRLPVATPERSGGFCSSITAGRWITTLARSNNSRSIDRLRSPTRSETPDPGASLGFAAGFCDPHHLFVSRHGPLPLTAWLPGCCYTERNNPPRGSR